jgi:hypothetical protein
MPKADEKVEQAGGKQQQKKLVKCVLVAQWQTLTNSRASLDSISAKPASATAAATKLMAAAKNPQVA